MLWSGGHLYCVRRRSRRTNRGLAADDAVQHRSTDVRKADCHCGRNARPDRSHAAVRDAGRLFLDGLHYWLPSIRPWHRWSGSSLPMDAFDRSNLAANCLLLLACSLAASLRSARILSAVGKTAVAAVLMGILMSAVSYVLFEEMNVGRGSEGAPIGVNAAGGLLLLAGSLIFLSRPWHLGRISEQNSFRDRWLQALSPDWTESLETCSGSFDSTSRIRDPALRRKNAGRHCADVDVSFDRT